MLCTSCRGYYITDHQSNFLVVWALRLCCPLHFFRPNEVIEKFQRFQNTGIESCLPSIQGIIEVMDYRFTAEGKFDRLITPLLWSVLYPPPFSDMTSPLLWDLKILKLPLSAICTYSGRVFQLKKKFPQSISMIFSCCFRESEHRNFLMSSVQAWRRRFRPSFHFSSVNLRSAALTAPSAWHCPLTSPHSKAINTTDCNT